MIVAWLVGLCALTVLAFPYVSVLAQRYRQNGQLKPVPFVSSVDVPLLSFVMLELAFLSSATVWRLDDWCAVAWFLFPSALIGFAPTMFRLRTARSISQLPRVAPEDSLDFRDNPIVSPEQDFLDRTDLITRLTADMSSTSRDAALIYGLFGPQGGGKTSFLNLLRQRLQEMASSDFLVISFDPWYFSGPSALVDSFYGAIDRAVNQRYLLPNLRKLLARYTATIKAGVSWLKFAEISVSGGQPGIWELKARIEELLLRLPERVVLLIDDLDRIPSVDLETVLRLVRLTGDFPNIVVVLSCDPVRLRPSPGDPQSIPALLEKTAQTVVTLPPASREALDQYLYFSSGPAGAPTRLSAIDQLFCRWKVPSARVAAFEKEFTTYYQFEFRFGFRTPRDIKRFLASLQLSLASLWPEVNLFDYLLLEYLKVFAIDVWSDIWDNSNIWVGSDLKRGFGLSPRVLEDERGDLKAFREHLEKLLGVRPEREFLLGILGHLFPRAAGALSESKPSYSRSAFSEQRVQSWEHFGKYFRQVIERGDVPDQTLTKVLDAIQTVSSDEGVATIVTDALAEHRKSGSLRRFLQKLEAYSSDVSEGARAAIVRAVAVASDQFSVEGWRDFNSEFDAARHLVLATTDAVWQAHGRELMRFVISEAPRLSFVLNVFSYTMNEPGRSAYWNLRSPELFDALCPIVIQRLGDRFGPGKSDLLEVEGDNAIYVLIMWSSLGKDAARPDLEALMDARPELWARLVKGYLDPFGDLRLKEMTTVFDPKWLLKLGERYEVSFQTDSAALRALAILRRVLAPKPAGTAEESIDE